MTEPRDPRTSRRRPSFSLFFFFFFFSDDRPRKAEATASIAR